MKKRKLRLRRTNGHIVVTDISSRNPDNREIPILIGKDLEPATWAQMMLGHVFCGRGSRVYYLPKNRIPDLLTDEQPVRRVGQMLRQVPLQENVIDRPIVGVGIGRYSRLQVNYADGTREIFGPKGSIGYFQSY